MVELSCQDYGFDCDFEIHEVNEHNLSQFGQHTQNEHGIEYSKESLMQVVLRKK